MAEAATEAGKRGGKTVIAGGNTLESALKQYIDAHALRVGDRVELTFKDLLRRYLERSREVVITDENGDSRQHYLTDEELSPEGVKAYQRAAKMIEDAKLDLPA